MKLPIKYDRNPHQNEFHSDLTTKLLHMSGGFGCMRDETKVITQRGPIPIADITSLTPVLSWSEKNNRFELSLSSHAYPKGKANLYRVITTQGEFVASAHHRVFCAGGNYQCVEHLQVGDAFLGNDSFPLVSTLVPFPQESILNDHRLRQIVEDYLDNCVSDNHRYDQQPRHLQDNAQSFFPSLNDARKLFDNFYLKHFSRLDDRQVRKQEHIHHDQFFAQKQKHHFLCQADPHVDALANQAFSSMPAHILPSNPNATQSLLSCDGHHKDQLSFVQFPSFNSSLSKSTILAIEKLPFKEWYWDMHVLGNNNYVTIDGTIHHNSGKSHGLAMKLIQLSAINKYCDGGLVCPTYGDFKKDMLPIFEDIFESNNIKNWNYHKGDHFFSFPWTKRKLWVASAETKLRGPNWGYAGINEVTLIPLLRYREVLGRVRDKRTSIPQIVSVATPEGTQSDYYNFFIENPPQDDRMSIKVIYADTRDNAANLDPGYIAMLESAYDKTMIDAYLKGLWVNMNGNQFYYSYDPAKNHDKTIEEVPGSIVHCFLDFNVEHMTATLWHLFDNTLYGFSEIVLDNNADTNKMASALKARGFTPDRTIIYPDPAGSARSTKGQPDHTILRNAGFEVRARSSQPRFRQRQLNVNNLLDKARIIFNPDTMPALKKDLEGVEQDPVTLEKSKSNAKLTHASDGLDYGCDILFEFSGKKPQTKIMRVR